MPIIVKPLGFVGTKNIHEAFRALVQTEGRRRAATVSALTNNSGGTAGTLTKQSEALTQIANTGSNLADKTTTEAAWNTVLDAIGEIFSKANALATPLGVTTVTNNAGGTSPDSTIGAVTVSVTGAATGVLAANTNTVHTAFNNAIYRAAVLTNHLAAATGNSLIAIASDYKVTPLVSTVAAITVDGGTAASPGVLKADIDAALVVFRNNIKTIASKLITINTTTAPLVIAQ